MRRSTTAALAAVTLLLASAQPATAGGHRGGARVTGTYSTDAAHAWEPLPVTRVGADDGSATDATVVVDPSQARQRYSGIGFSLDETSVSNLWKLTPAERDRAIRLLVDPKTGAGFDRFRLTIGSPDLIEHLPFWSYDEPPAGVTDDFGLKYFSIKRDIDLHIVDTVKLIQKYNPRATFFASAWSAPAWMKTNDQFTGEVALKPGSTTDYYQVGKLRDDCIEVFARYYAAYVRAYARQGIRVDAITLLNEPGIDVVYPAMDISIAQQQKLAVAIKREFRAARLDTQLYVHDFNFWDWKDPNSTATKNYYRILDDPATAAAADSIAFHPYWGDPTVMRDAFEQYHKPVQMTETSDLSPATVLSYFRLDASSYILWAQTTDQDGGTLHWTPLRDNNVDWDQIAATTHWTNRLVTADTITKTFSVRDELYPLGQFASVPAGAYATYRWSAQVPDARRNHPPVLAPVAPVTADQYGTTTIRLEATDPDRDRLAYYATDLPDGVALDARTGVVTLHPTTAGTQDLTFYVTDGAARSSATVHLRVLPHGAPIGAKVEAEAYVDEHGWVDGGANFVESNPATSGGKDVGWTAPGNWLHYRLDVAAAGTYDLELRVANGTGAAAPDAVSFRDAAGTKLAVLTVPDTGGWGTYQSIHVPVTLSAGDQLVTVYCETGGFNLDYLRLT